MTVISPSFIKYHGNGNDFIIFVLSEIENRVFSQRIINIASRLCHRHLGIGADGIILLNEESTYWHMIVVNADGSLAKNCGNGLRCAAQAIFKQNKLLDTVTIKLGDNFFICRKDGAQIAVDMGLCHLSRLKNIYLESCGINAQVAKAHIGNEHLIFLMEKPTDLPPDVLVEIKARFNDVEKYNLGFVFKDNFNRFHSSVYERGVGFTNSCGSGACAAASFIAFLDLQPSSLITISQAGGDIDVFMTLISQNKEEAVFHLCQRGPAEDIFKGICQVLSSW